MSFFHIIFFLIICLAVQAEQLKLNISARSAILINAETGAILFEKNPLFPCHPASITKIATALYVLEQKSHGLDQMVMASQEAVGVVSPEAKRLGGDKYPPYRLTSDGTHMNLRVGETLLLRELLHGLLISSGNDAANVIAESLAPSITHFMEELNSYLKEIGCLNTHFVNPHGLPHPQQITTAQDMATISVRAMQYPLFRQIVMKREHSRPETNKQTPSLLVQSNKLLKPGPFFYSKAIGIKTGFTNAGYNLVAAAKEGERTLIAVLLYCGDSNQRFKDAIALFDAAFNEKKRVRTLLTKDHERFKRLVKGGKTPLEAALIEDIQIDYFPSEEPRLKGLLKWDLLKLPIEEGTKVGEIQLVDPQGILFKAVPLFAKQEVKAHFIAQVGNIYELAKARKTLIVALIGLSGIISGLIMIKSKYSRGKKEQ